MQSKFNSIFGFIKLTRAWNLAIVLSTQLIVAYFLVIQESLGEIDFDLGLFLLIFSTLCIAAAGYLINDYYDVKIDYINKPERVVVGRTLKRRIVLLIHTVLNGIALVVGVYLGLKILLINFFSATLLWLYSNQLKRMPVIGNLSVAILTATTILIIGVYYNYYQYNIILYSLFAFIYTLIREIIKDVEDMRGDSEFGLRTLPIIAGVRKTKIIIYSLIITFNVATFFIVDLNEWFWRLFIVVLTFMNLNLLLILYRADKVIDFNRLSTYCKFLMILGILSMVFVV